MNGRDDRERVEQRETAVRARALTRTRLANANNDISEEKIWQFAGLVSASYRHSIGYRQITHILFTATRLDGQGGRPATYVRSWFIVDDDVPWCYSMVALDAPKHSAVESALHSLSES